MYDSKYSGEQVEALLDKVNNLNNTGGDNSSCVQKTDENVQHIVGGLIIGSTNTPSAMLSGKHKGRIMLTGVENPLVGVQAGTIPYYVQAHENNMYIGPARPNATSVDKDGKVTMPSNLYVVKDIYEKGTSLSEKYASKEELRNTELAISDYVPRKIEEFKDKLENGTIDLGFVKSIIVNNSNPIPPDSNGVVNLGYLGGESAGDGETTLGPILDIQINGESIVTNGVAQIYKAATDRLGVVMLSHEYNKEDDDTKAATQKALYNAYTELAANKQNKIENLSDYVTKDMMPAYEGDGIYFNDGDDGNNVGFTIYCGEGLSINETTRALQVNTDDVKLRNRFKTINKYSIFGEGDLNLFHLMEGYEGGGIYFNTDEDEGLVGLTIQCGNGLSINETDKSLQVNIGNGLAFDETGALTATGSGNVNLSGYVTDEELATTKADLEKEINSQGQQLTELRESAIRAIQINGNSLAPDPEEEQGLLKLSFKNINGESIIRISEDDPENIVITGGDGTLDSSLYVTKEDFNNSLKEKLNKELVYKWTIGDDDKVSSDEYSKIESADIVLIQDKNDTIYVADKPRESGRIVLITKSINDNKVLERTTYTLVQDSYTVVTETIQIPTYTSDLEDYEETTNLLVESLELSKYLTKEEFQQDISNYVREDMMYTYEGNGIYYNDGDDGENKSFNVYCGNGLSINDETKALQVNIGKGLAFDEETKALIATGSAAYPLVNHGTSDTTFTLTPNVFHVWSNVASLTLTLGSGTDGVANEYLFQFSCLGGQVTTLGLPSGIQWANGEVPTLEVLKTYQVSILNNCATIQSFG